MLGCFSVESKKGFGSGEKGTENRLRRPEWKGLKSFVKKGQVDCLSVWHIHRLGGFKEGVIRNKKKMLERRERDPSPRRCGYQTEKHPARGGQGKGLGGSTVTRRQQRKQRRGKRADQKPQKKCLLLRKERPKTCRNRGRGRIGKVRSRRLDSSGRVLLMKTEGKKKSVSEKSAKNLKTGT